MWGNPGFSADPYNYNIRRHVVTHEMGHAVGIGHQTCNNSSIMGTTQCTPFIWSLTTTDKSNLNSMYN